MLNESCKLVVRCDALDAVGSINEVVAGLWLSTAARTSGSTPKS